MHGHSIAGSLLAWIHPWCTHTLTCQSPCTRPLASIAEVLGSSRFLVAEDDPNQNQTSRHIHMTNLLGVGNSWMAGEAGHPIWVNATYRLLDVRNKVRDETGELAGVWFIRQLVQPFR